MIIAVSDPDLSLSQINKLSKSRKKKSINAYESLKMTIKTETSTVISIKARSPKSNFIRDKSILDIRHPRELDSLIRTLKIPCRHNTDWCLHDQLFQKDQNGKTLRQLCEFRADWSKQIKYLEKEYERYLRTRPYKSVEIRSEQLYVHELADKAMLNPQFAEYAKISQMKTKTRIEIRDTLLSQFEEVQNRKRFQWPPTFWSFLDCTTCNTNI